MYKNICIIGVGTLGGFLAKSISEFEGIKEISIIDYDIVESKNLINSIYERSQLGEYKVTALTEIINRSNPEISIKSYIEKFIENKTDLDLTGFDLVIDCRDFTYDRGDQIDSRLYITSRYLIIDCRKNINYDLHQEGSYNVQLTKYDLRNAAFQASLLINDGSIQKLIGVGAVQKIELDYMKKTISETLNNLNTPADLIYEPNELEHKLVNLKENFYPILEQNKREELTICLGDRNQCSITTKIPQNTIATYNDLLMALAPMLNLPYTYNSYLVEPKKIDNHFVIELLPETGAA